MCVCVWGGGRSYSKSTTPQPFVDSGSVSGRRKWEACEHRTVLVMAGRRRCGACTQRFARKGVRGHEQADQLQPPQTPDQLRSEAIGLADARLGTGATDTWRRLFYGCSYMIHLSGDNSRDR